MKAGWSLFKVRTAEGLQYRLAALSGVTVSVFWVLIEVAVLTVFFTYGNREPDSSVNGMTLAQAISYRWIGELMYGLVAAGVEGGIRDKITSGDIGIELIRPLDLYWHWFARTSAGSISNLVMRGGLTVTCGALISLIGFRGMGLGLPASPLYFCLFLISTLGAILFGTAYCMFLATVRANVAWGDGPVNLINVTGMILSGGFLPLQLWPDFMQTFLRLQPFASYYDTPAKLYAGTIAVEDGLRSLLVQVLWIAAFIALGKVILKRKIKTVVVQGG